MDLEDVTLGPDENCVLQYFNKWPGEFVAEKQIVRHADSRKFIAPHLRENMERSGWNIDLSAYSSWFRKSWWHSFVRRH